MRVAIAAIGCAMLASAPMPAECAPATRPNVLFIAVDDLNDFVGCLGGHAQVKTPNIDRLAKRGILFTDAHCAAPLCNPSRAAVFSGRQPIETGVFANVDTNIRKIRPDIVLLPQHFQTAGYQTFGCGKLLHQTSSSLFDEDFFPEQRWSPFSRQQMKYSAEELPSKGTRNPRHILEFNGQRLVLPLNRMPSDRAADSPEGESFDWGPLDIDDLAMGDGQIAQWSADRLGKTHGKPFFIAVGFYRPHTPLFAPKKYFDMYGGMEIKLPEVLPDDLVDLSSGAQQRALSADTAGEHATVLKFGQWPAAVKSYLACVSFIDAQIGRLLDALDSGPNADNTFIVLWSDHGWHLGEKQHWGKWTGWQRSTRVVLSIAPPRDTPAGTFATGASCAEPVSLLDIYPTLVELCGLPSRAGLSGQSMVPLMKHPQQSTGRVVLTTFDKGNYSATEARWHYIRYSDGSEELYDRHTDPHEWRNLAHRSELDSIKLRMAGLLPRDSDYPVPAAGGSGAKKSKKGT